MNKTAAKARAKRIRELEQEIILLVENDFTPRNSDIHLLRLELKKLQKEVANV